MAGASRKVGRDVLTYLKDLREQREENGTPVRHKIMAQAGLDKRKTH